MLSGNNWVGAVEFKRESRESEERTGRIRLRQQQSEFTTAVGYQDREPESEVGEEKRAREEGKGNGV